MISGKTGKTMKVGDCIMVDYHEPIRNCTWTDGYKFEFLFDTGEFDTWTKSDLEIAGAEVISECR